jgi:alpha-D-ribose 1-methylphosphonate 5-triphosphate synthase subunit PhnH
MPRELADPGLDSQRTFRAVLDAMARPGRVLGVTGPLESPLPLDPATAAVCLALGDLDTPLWLDSAAARPAVREYLRFHCGVPIVAAMAGAHFAVVADAWSMPPLEAFEAGDDEVPERSATLIVQVEGFRPGTGRRLAGPGILREVWLDVVGLPERFWAELEVNHARFPCGVDVILTAGFSVVALPRSTQVHAQA